MSVEDLAGAALITGAAWVWWKGRAQAQVAPNLVPVSYTPQGQGAGKGQAQANATGAAIGLFNSILGLIGGATAPAQSQPAQPAPQSTGGLFMGAQSGNLAPLLDTIASGEAGPAGYDAVYLGSPIQPPAPISTMTVAQVLAFQSQMIAAGSASSAVGRYQFIHRTLAGLVSDGTLNRGEVFGPGAQDRAATALMQRRGLGAYQSGQISAGQFADNLAKEWASLPVVTGPKAGGSYYGGVGNNQARVSVASITSAIQGIA